ncbi:MAG: bacteriocin-protection protein [Bacteroidetes bacterium]|nr:bacteriocin-protection protein [Bacteroidota bacterium]
MEILFFPTPNDFRDWLDANHEKLDEQWIGFYKKKTGKASITWPQSVDEALCYGWIDGLRKSIDEKSYKIRFTPRRPTSHWSDVNVRRFKELKKEGRIQPAGLAAYKKKKDDNTARASYEQNKLEFSEAYIQKIKSNKVAWAYYKKLPPYALKASKWYVLSAKQEKTRQRRLQILIDSCEEGKKIPQLRKKGE